jgi:K+-transporting ATPase ATPase A chain
MALGLVMLVGRYVSIIAMLAIAGSLATKRVVPASTGTLRTDTSLFTGILVLVILIIGALTFFPAVAIGPIAEHLGMFH